MAERRKFPSGQQDQYMLRFPDGMRDRLKDEAAKNKRSLNAEIVARLESSLKGEIPIDDPENLTFRLKDGEFSFFEVIKSVIDAYEDAKRAPKPENETSREGYRGEPQRSKYARGSHRIQKPNKD